MKSIRLRPDAKGELPLIPLRELVVFPHSVVPFFVGRPASLRALNAATSSDREVILAFQKNTNDDPTLEDVHPIGTVGRIVQVLKLPDGNMRVLVEGRSRVLLKRIRRQKDVKYGQYRSIPEDETGTEVLLKNAKDDYLAYAKLRSKKLPKEVTVNVKKADTVDKLVGNIVSALEISIEKKIPFLLELDPRKRVEELSVLLRMENEFQGLRNDISDRVKKLAIREFERVEEGLRLVLSLA